MGPDLCPHFGTCGGCKTQDVAYDAQLAAKQQSLRELFANHWSGDIPIEPSPRVWHYRNKVEVNFGRKHYPEPPPKGFVKDTVLGFKRAGKWYWTLDIETCLIAPEGVDELLEGLRGWYRAGGLRAYDSRRQDGSLRFVVVRRGERTGQRMVVLITAPTTLDRAALTQAVDASWPATSLQWGVRASRGEQAVAERLEVLAGPPTIDEVLHVPTCDGIRNLTFRISPSSFFQTNTLGTERLYGRIRQWVLTAAPEVVFDLYGGSGGIALTVADRVPSVESVESWAEASEDGVYNARRNEVDNVRFVTDSVEKYLGKLKVADGAFPPRAVVVADPPRAGLHPKALRRLVELTPDHIIYVSCKPSVLASELDTLTTAYRLAAVEAVDLFPHTHHVEVLARLERL